jgi:hypothetical protein
MANNNPAGVSAWMELRADRGFPERSNAMHDLDPTSPTLGASATATPPTSTPDAQAVGGSKPSSRLVREAQRLVAGRHRRTLRVEVRGAEREILDRLDALAATRGLDTEAVLALLILHGHRTVTKALEDLPLVAKA